MHNKNDTNPIKGSPVLAQGLFYRRVFQFQNRYNCELKKLEKDGASEDVIKDAEGEMQKIHDAYMRKIDELFEKKEKDVMTI